MIILMTIAFLLAGAAVLVQIHAVQQAAPIVYQVAQEDIQILPADHPITKALVEASKGATKPQTPAPSLQEEAPAQPTPSPAPVLPPIVIVVPPAPTAPAPEAPAPVPAPVPVATTSPKTQTAYMPKAPDVVLKVNGQEVDTITVSKGSEVKLEWSVNGEESQVSFSFIPVEGAGGIYEGNVEAEGHREFTMESDHTFKFEAVGKSSGLGTKKTITVTVQ